MALPNAKWYDEATLDEMHEDLKREYSKTLAVIADRPVLAKHFTSCVECKTIQKAQEQTGSVELDAHRRRKLVLGYAELHALLGLKPTQEIAALEVRQDPLTLAVILTGPDEPVTLLNVESPISVLSVEAA
jgi:hypothetical protein